MSTIQQQMQVYHALEVVLRTAADTQQPLTLRDIWEVASIKDVARKETQIRDKLKVLLAHKLVTKVTVAQSASGSKMSRIGYMWANLDKSADDELNYRNSATGAMARKKPEPPPVPSQDVEIEFNGMVVYAGRNVEMFISDVKCVVDKNPLTGMVRIHIE
jgi:hypothetical protein